MADNQDAFPTHALSWLFPPAGLIDAAIQSGKDADARKAAAEAANKADADSRITYADENVYKDLSNPNAVASNAQKNAANSVSSMYSGQAAYYARNAATKPTQTSATTAPPVSASTLRTGVSTPQPLPPKIPTSNTPVSNAVVSNPASSGIISGPNYLSPVSYVPQNSYTSAPILSMPPTGKRKVRKSVKKHVKKHK